MNLGKDEGTTYEMSKVGDIGASGVYYLRTLYMPMFMHFLLVTDALSIRVIHSSICFSYSISFHRLSKIMSIHRLVSYKANDHAHDLQ
jgi:hypothetical protein